MTSKRFLASRRRVLLSAALLPVANRVWSVELARIAPAAGQPLRIAFGSCARQNKPQPIWSAIDDARPDLFVFLGDNLYADAQDAETLRRRYAEFHALEVVQRFRARVPHIAIWDDHDYGDDDVGGDYPLKDLSRELFCDEWGERADSPRRTRSGIYESYRLHAHGRSVQIILTDLRFNRSPLVADPARRTGYASMMAAGVAGQEIPGWYVPNPDQKAALLGAEQWAWLEAQLAEPADVRILGSTIQFCAEGTGWEAWSNFPHERQRFVELLKKTRAEKLFVISGDMHYGELSRLDVPGGYPLWDLTSSGLTEVWAVPTPNARRMMPVLAEPNFGLIEIDPKFRTATLSVRDVRGALRIERQLALQDLKF